MNAVLAVARREVGRNRLLLIAAPIAGVLPLAIRAVESLWRAPGGSAVPVGAFLAVTLPPAAAVALGASLLAPESAEGRLRFYFSRPLSATALWAGKWLAATGLLLAVVAGTALPSLIATGRLPDADTLRLGFIALAGLVLTLGASHVLALVYRTRSWRWLAFDAAAGGVLLAVVWTQFVGLLRDGAGAAVQQAFPWLLLAPVAAPLAASAAQLGWGGADPRRGRLSHSLALWATGAVLVAGFGVFGVRLRSYTPYELGASWAVAVAPNGTSVIVVPARRPGIGPVFALDAESRRFARAASAERMGGWPAFSGDGRLAGWVAEGSTLRARRYSELLGSMGAAGDQRMPLLADWFVNGLRWRGDVGGALILARFGSGDPDTREVALDPGDGWEAVLSLDPAAGTAVLASRRELGVLELGTGRVVARLAVRPLAVDPLPGGRLRVFADEPAAAGRELVVLEWDPASGERVDHIRVGGGGSPFTLTRAGRQALVLMVARGEQRLVGIDLATGETRALGEGPFQPRPVVPLAPLSTGEVAVLSSDGELQLLSPTGETLASWPLGASVWNVVEWRPGQLAVGLGRPGAVGWEPDLSPPRTEVFDVSGRAPLRTEAGLLPAAPPLWRPAPQPAVPGSYGASLFLTEGGGLVRLGADGTREVVIPDASE